MVTPVGFLGSISIDCPDPDALAPFYRGLLGLDEAFATPDRGVVSLSGAGPMLTLMRVGTYVAPSWPEGPQPQQMHLDVGVDDVARRRCQRSRWVPPRQRTSRRRISGG